MLIRMTLIRIPFRKNYTKHNDIPKNDFWQNDMQQNNIQPTKTTFI
jgi:hypothetical protein